MIAKFECVDFKVEGKFEVVKQVVELLTQNTPPSGRYQCPELHTGEKYAGIILGEETGLPLYHLILLPGETGGLNWMEAQEWVQEQGGELPLRREQSLLFANLRQYFNGTGYWSADQVSDDYVWAQDFTYGSQSHYAKGNILRARSVRREYI